MKVTEKQLELIRHALGGRKITRNYFFVDFGSKLCKDLDELVDKDLMYVVRSEIYNGFFYHVTDEGVRIAGCKV